MKKSMYIVVLLMALALFFPLYFTGVNARAAKVTINKKNFPDMYFRFYIKDTIDTNGDGKLSNAEKRAVKELDVGETSEYQLELEYPKVESLKGIEHFPNLEILYCSESSLESLDVSRNKKLRELDCSANMLEKLNLSQNKLLRVLNCSNNDLNVLKVSKNKKLKWLFCDYNHLKKINVSKNRKLTNLSVSHNRIRRLKVTKLKGLKELYCEGNRLKNLSVTKNKKLVALNCGENKIKKLVLKKNTDLDYLVCSENRLRKLDLSKNRLLQYLYCEKNQMVTGNCRILSSQLEGFKISPQKRKIRIRKKGKRYFVPLPGLAKTDAIIHLSKGRATEKGIWLKRKKIPRKLTYKYNMFADGGKKTKVIIYLKR